MELTESVQDLVQVVHGLAAFNQELDSLVGGADRLGDLVDVLRLDNGPQIILQNLGEVV
jgi:hypothetical protein